MQASEDNGQEQEQAEPTGNLGTRLKRAREARNLSLEDLSQELRIAPNHLEALEQCRFDVLGPPVFAKGYLKHYAARLGLDVAAAVADYERVAGNTRIVVTPSKTIRLRDERQITVWIVAGLALVLLAVFLVLWWMRQDFGDFGFSREPATAAAPLSRDVATPVARVATEPPAARPESRPSAAQPETEPLAAQPETEPLAARPETEPPAASTTVAAPAARTEESPAGAAREPSRPPETAAPLAAATAAREFRSAATAGSAAGGRPALEVRFVEDSWAEITAGDGERLFYDLALAGTVERVPLDPDVNLLFGNAGGVELSLEGERLAVPATARRRGDLAEFRLGTLLD